MPDSAMCFRKHYLLIFTTALCDFTVEGTDSERLREPGLGFEPRAARFVA